MPIPTPLLTLSANGQAFLNREASRVLPVYLRQVRLTPPTPSGLYWWLLPGVAGGAVVHSRADRLGYLRFWAPELAAHAFAAWPPGTRRLYFELQPIGDGFFALRFARADDEK